MPETIKVELYTSERDFIVELLEYSLLDELLSKLKKAKPNKESIVRVSLDNYDLEQLIGNLSLEANHNKKRSIQEFACDIAERLEMYLY